MYIVHTWRLHYFKFLFWLQIKGLHKMQSFAKAIREWFLEENET